MYSYNSGTLSHPKSHYLTKCNGIFNSKFSVSSVSDTNMIPIFHASLITKQL